MFTLPRSVLILLVFTNFAFANSDLVYYASDGCSTNAQADFFDSNAPGYFFPNESVAEISCCTHDGSACTRKNPNNGQCWTGDNDEFKVTWAVAQQTCAEAGYRLCESEAELDQCCHSGCNYNNQLVWTNIAQSPVNGCTDPIAENYDSAATINDGSCEYNLVYYASDGCSTNSQADFLDSNAPGYFFPNESVAEISCCTHDGSACTRKTPNNGKCWTGDNDEFKVTWAVAQQTCSEAGYRLCESEAELDQCCGSECNYDNQLVWTNIAQSPGRRALQNKPTGKFQRLLKQFGL